MPGILIVLFMDSIFSFHIGLLLSFFFFCLIRKPRLRKVTELAEVTWTVGHRNGIYM